MRCTSDFRRDLERTQGSFRYGSWGAQQVGCQVNAYWVLSGHKGYWRARVYLDQKSPPHTHTHNWEQAATLYLADLGRVNVLS